MAGAWAQTPNYPQQTPNYPQQAPSQQGSNREAAPQTQTPNYPQQAPSQQGSNEQAAPQAQQQDSNDQGSDAQAATQDQDRDNPQESNEQAAPQDQDNQQQDQNAQEPNDQRPSLQAGPQGQSYPQQGPNGSQGPGGRGPNGEAAPKSEGPAPAVARISLIHGDVTKQRGDSGEWGATTINAPLVLGDQVATGEKSRTEIQLDYANFLRMAAGSQVKIADLSRTRIQVQVAKGYASYTMLKGAEAEVEIDSPNVAVRPLKPGRYRVQVNSDSETDVIVREGEAEITTPQGSTRVREGELITIRGTDNPEYKVSDAPAKDDWDRWNKDRDSVIREAEGPRRTNRYYTGANDLDGYGRWVYVPGYGDVWQPYQQATWAPYQTGRWVWEPYYGWTWVSYEPWGWTPYHYGRWFYYGNNWCWWPGPVYGGYRPLWSPAFVFFVGFGHRSGFGFGSIGWFPVGPHDAFYPWYGRGFNRVNVVSITNISVVNRGGGFIGPLAVRGRQPFFSNANLALTNPRVRGSITSVSSADFGRGGSAGLRHGVEEQELRGSSVMTGNLPVVPTRESLHSGSGNGAGPAGIQTRSSDRFFTKHAPPAGPESFHDQAARVQRVVGPQAGGNVGGGVNVRTGNSGANANGGVNVRTGNNEGPRSGGAQTGASGAQNSGSVQQSHGEAGNGRPGKSEGGNSAEVRSEPQRDRGGWSKFGPPSGRSTTSAIDSGRVGQTPSSTTGSNGRQAGDQGASKPPLELHRPIVTPRQPEVRNEQRNTPPPSRTPDVRNQPRSSGPQQRSAPRYSPPPQRSESHQSRGSSGSSSRGSSGSSSHGSGGHGNSKSSSSPKQR
jgi:hypothetical protein